RDPELLARTHSAEHRLLVERVDEPILHVGVLRELRRGRVEAAFRVRRALGRIDDLIFRKTVREEHLARTAYALARRRQLIARDPGRSYLIELPSAALHFRDEGLADLHADLVRGDPEVRYIRERLPARIDELIVDGHELHALQPRTREDRGTEPNVRRANHEALRALGGEIVDGRHDLLAVRHAHSHELEPELFAQFRGRALLVD